MSNDTTVKDLNSLFNEGEKEAQGLWYTRNSFMSCFPLYSTKTQEEFKTWRFYERELNSLGFAIEFPIRGRAILYRTTI